MNAIGDINQIINQANQVYFDYHLKQRIQNAIVGKFLIEEISKLPADADSFVIYKARERAREKAKLFAEIIISAKNAKLLIKELANCVLEAREVLRNLDKI